ncbi:MAG: hypothetical protein U0263_31720 [Polyangiaceae bacterium]
MASPFSPPRFVRDQDALEAGLVGIKLAACPHCRQVGTLIGHGVLRGYAERSSASVVRGRRILCSNRGRRPGCGRTFSVLLSTVVPGFVVRTLTLWCFAKAVLSGLSRRSAWLCEAGASLALSSGYRLWRRLSAAQSALRSRLWREAPAPSSSAHEPLAQLVAHLAMVVGAGQDDADLFEAFQRGLGLPLFAR